MGASTKTSTSLPFKKTYHNTRLARKKTLPKRPRLSERNANVKTNNAEENSTSRERRRTTPSEPKKTKSEELSKLKKPKLLKLKPLLLNPSRKRSSKKLPLLRK